MTKVAIVTDSTAALPENIIKENDLIIVPLSLIWDGKTYIDGIEIKPREFYERLTTSKTIPTTSQPSVAAFSDVYTTLIEQGYDILTITISSKLSGTYLSATQAVEQFPRGRIEVFDSLLTSIPLAMVAILASRAAKQGATLLECRHISEDIAKRAKLYFAVETLEYLQKGGRIGAASKFLGTALNLKPILELKDGLITARERVRTSKKAHARLIELVEEEIGLNGKIEYLGIVSANAPDASNELQKAAHNHFRINQEIVGELCPVIGTHVGPGTVGIAFIPGT